MSGKKCWALIAVAVCAMYLVVASQPRVVAARVVSEASEVTSPVELKAENYARSGNNAVAFIIGVVVNLISNFSERVVGNFGERVQNLGDSSDGLSSLQRQVVYVPAGALDIPCKDCVTIH